MRRKIKDENSLWIFDQIIDSGPVSCPVGYYTSPWFANLYLEEMDWFIVQQLYKERRGKRIRYVKHYLRYVDDMLLLGTSKSDLHKAIRVIQKVIAPLKLELKDEWEIKAIGKHEIIDGKWKLKPGTYWIDIGGYKFCKDSTVLRDGIYLSAKRDARIISKNGYTIHKCRSINSKIGWASHVNSTRFIENDIKAYINIKSTRRYISDVDKERKQQQREAGRD